MGRYRYRRCAVTDAAKPRQQGRLMAALLLSNRVEHGAIEGADQAPEPYSDLVGRYNSSFTPSRSSISSL